jgi:ABC-type nitrate/sulfonate/bicarbonate transport system substrate-binding protein
VKLLLNEMWSAEIARQLRRRGHDVVAATELPARYRGQPDHVVFARARDDNRLVVTDKVPDFAVLVAEAASRDEPHPGVVFVVRPAFDRAGPGVVSAMTRALDAVICAGEPVRGARFLTPGMSVPGSVPEGD